MNINLPYSCFREFVCAAIRHGLERDSNALSKWDAAVAKNAELLTGRGRVSDGVPFATPYLECFIEQIALAVIDISSRSYDMPYSSFDVIDENGNSCHLQSVSWIPVEGEQEYALAAGPLPPILFSRGIKISDLVLDVLQCVLTESAQEICQSCVDLFLEGGLLTPQSILPRAITAIVFVIAKYVWKCVKVLGSREKFAGIERCVFFNAWLISGGNASFTIAQLLERYNVCGDNMCNYPGAMFFVCDKWDKTLCKVKNQKTETGDLIMSACVSLVNKKYLAPDNGVNGKSTGEFPRSVEDRCVILVPESDWLSSRGGV